MSPQRLCGTGGGSRIAESSPRLPVVLAHVGLGWQEKAVALAQAYPNVYFDTCLVITGTSNHPPLSDDEIVSLLRLVGLDRVMFAADWPLCVLLKERKRAGSLPLLDAERRLLFYENARRILRI